jgi:hypothetical protein
MDAVDWTALSVLVTVFVAVVLGAFGFLARQISRLDDRVSRLDEKMDTRFDRVDARIDRLDERYVRHLELHATH